MPDAERVERPPRPGAVQGLETADLVRAPDPGLRDDVRLHGVAALPIELGIDRDDPVGTSGPRRVEPDPGPGAQPGHDDPVVAPPPEVLDDLRHLRRAVGVVGPSRGVPEIGALPPARKVEPHRRVPTDAERPCVLHPGPTRADVGLRSRIEPYDRRPSILVGFGQHAHEAAASQSEHLFGEPLAVPRRGRGLRRCGVHLAAAHPPADLLHDAVGHLGVLGGPVEGDGRTGQDDVLGVDPQGTDPLQQGVARRSVVPVDHEDFPGRERGEVGEVDRAEVGQRVPAEQAARVDDPTGQFLVAVVVGDRPAEQLQLAGVGPPLDDRRPGDHPVGVHGVPLEECERSAEADPSQDERRGTDPSQERRRIADRVPPGVQASRIPGIPGRVP